MTLLATLEAQIRETVAARLDVSPADVQFDVPPSLEFGDIAVPCFPFAKKLKKAPLAIAADLAQTLKPDAQVSRWTAAGPYLNISLNRQAVGKKLLAEVAKAKEKFGTSAALKGERIMVEYVSPNTNKPLHIGHARNAFLGWTVAELLRAQGAKVVKAELVNDRGIHIAKTIVAYRTWAKGKSPKSKGDRFVADLYVRFSQEEKKNPALTEAAQDVLRKWEAGDKQVRAVWKMLRTLVLAGFRETYQRLGIDFDTRFFESDIYQEGKDLVELGLKKGVLKQQEDGSVIAPLEPDMPDKIMLRKDGTSLYVTQDLALAVQKAKRYKLTRSIYCVGQEQDLALRQLFKILELLGFKERLEHLSYGLVFLPEGKMKSREGTVVDADDLLDELEALAAAAIAKRYPKLSKKEKAKRTKAIALASIKYHFLMVGKRSPVQFDPAASISFEGNTGPYLQYTYARAASILRKAKRAQAVKRVTTDDATWAVCLDVLRFSGALQKAADARDPAVLCQALFSLAQQFNNWYHRVPVLDAPADERGFRVRTVQTVKTLLQSGLALLGIPVLEEM